MKSERGFALTVVILVTALLLSVTGTSLLFSRMGLKVSSHHKTGTMAFFATEAGVQHAWKELENGDGVNDFDAIHASSPGTVIVSNSAFSGGTYTVSLLESINSPKRIRIASVGTAANNSQARLEVWLQTGSGTAPKALITNGDLKLNGNPKLVGTRGGAHTNDDMQVSGNLSVEMAHGLTASNSATGGGGLNDGMDITGTPCIGSPACASNPQPDEYELNSTAERDAYEASHNSEPTYSIPKINPADYASAVAGNAAGYILKLDCNVVTGSGAIFSNGLYVSGGTAVPSPPSGWSCTGGTWNVTGNSAANGVFYAEGRVEIAGNPGSASSPWQATIVARDSVKISGNPEVVPYGSVGESLQNIFLLTGNDLEISGNPSLKGTGGGLFAHQQVKVSGNPYIKGFIMAGDGQPTWSGDPFPDSAAGVTMNEVSGNPTIVYSAEFGVSLLPPAVTQVGWFQSF
ncbi:MAG: pilus assembly PilX N-terminal domain-containing protein [Deltaproteobacteria bacterium]|nr:pilus assembly PilX N-terminal domain-containing protein [Deltaproteobacteria bacterium]